MEPFLLIAAFLGQAQLTDQQADSPKTPTKPPTSRAPKSISELSWLKGTWRLKDKSKRLSSNQKRGDVLLSDFICKEARDERNGKKLVAEVRGLTGNVFDPAFPLSSASFEWRFQTGVESIGGKLVAFTKASTRIISINKGRGLTTELTRSSLAATRNGLRIDMGTEMSDPVNKTKSITLTISRKGEALVLRFGSPFLSGPSRKKTPREFLFVKEGMK